MEKMVNRRLIWHLEKNKLLSENQFGFRKGKSTLDVLSVLENAACDAFVKKEYMALLSLDLTSAYDQCWRRGVIDNMTT
jgi:Reverse transcriptase (RNA-dependent DNA polymerase)